MKRRGHYHTQSRITPQPDAIQRYFLKIEVIVPERHGIRLEIVPGDNGPAVTGGHDLPIISGTDGGIRPHQGAVSTDSLHIDVEGIEIIHVTNFRRGSRFTGPGNNRPTQAVTDHAETCLIQGHRASYCPGTFGDF